MSRAVNVDFFAAEADQKALLDFLFSETDVRVFESYSEFDTELREFHSTEELAKAFPLGKDPHGNGNAVLLQLWSPSVMSNISIEKFSVNPESCNGHTFRHRIDSGGLMQLYLGGVSGNVITMSHFGCQSEARAQKWDVEEGVKWESLEKIAGKIQYHLRKRMAAGKVPGRPVLPQAMQLVRSGFELKLSTQTPWHFELEEK
ncbi:MAG TPA: hypothetical protein DCZ94_22685 [Lentisphaeria bacterium]|nr:MAG: hypothetical protein A2X48_13925 [Lentisphaerae bacterium GWF2_49_21]HBC89755.1 hypothetical protein [Lentisphaeria bacterium]